MHLHLDAHQLLHFEEVREVGDHAFPRFANGFGVAVWDHNRVHVLIVFDREADSAEGVDALLERAQHIFHGVSQSSPDLLDAVLAVGAPATDQVVGNTLQELPRLFIRVALRLDRLVCFEQVDIFLAVLDVLHDEARSG